MRYQYAMSCPTGKRRFATEMQAHIALDKIWSMRIKGTNKSEVSPCRYYYCKVCKGYHHTSQPLSRADAEG